MRFLWCIPAVLLAAFAGYLLYQKANTGRKAAPDGTVVATVAVARGDLHTSVRITGTVAAERSATIRAPRVMGSRSDVSRGGGGAHDHGPGGHPDFTLNLLRLAKPGTQVKSGDIVVEFDPENQLQRLDDYEDSVVLLKNSIRKMTANLAASKEAHEQKVRTARADWQKALLDLKTQPVRSKIDAEKLRLTAEEMELSYRRLAAERVLVEQSQLASIRDSELQLQKSALELERARNNLKRMTMTAPIDGIVVMATVVINGDLRQIRDGDQVSAGQPVLHVVDTGSMALSAVANQVDAERMHLGMQARIGLEAYPEVKISGTVVGIGAMARRSAFRGTYVGEIPIRVRIDGRDSRLLPDLTGIADIVLKTERDMVLAPRPAVLTDSGHAFVLAQQGDGWIRRHVETGLQNATHVAIRAGLEPGAIVALQSPR
jgi:multidrug resistance efflux pump